MTIDEAKNILDLNDPITITKVQQSFRRLAMQYHPDRFQTFTQKAWATRRFIKIKDARDLIFKFLKYGELPNSEKENGTTNSKGETYTSGHEEGKETFGKKENIKTPFDLFDKIFNIFPSKSGPIKSILEYLLLPIFIIFFFYLFWLYVFSELFQKIGIDLRPNSYSFKDRFLFLIISTIFAIPFLLICYSIGLNKYRGTEPTMVGIVIGISMSFLLIVFVVSEWISFFLVTSWMHPIKSELESLVLYNKKSK